MLDEQQLDEIRRRVEAASPGPWRPSIEGRDHESGSSVITVGEGSARRDDIELTGATPADYDFIAHARQDVPRLVEEVLRLQALLGHGQGPAVEHSRQDEVMARPQGSVDPAWREYRRRRWLMFGLWIGFIPGVMLLGLPHLYVFGLPEVLPGIAVPWMAVWAWSNYRLAKFPCPSCGRSFVAKEPWWGPWKMRQFASRCVHCGFPKWQSPPPGQGRGTADRSPS